MKKASGASDNAPDPVDVSDLFTGRTGLRYGYCKDSLVLRPKAGSEVVACSDLIEADIFAELIDRFSVQFEGADRRAIVSMWTLYYFSTLTIAVAVAGLELGRTLPASIDEMSLCVDSSTGAPQAFLLPHLGVETDAISIESALHSVLALHAAPLIDALARNSGVGRKMLWTNVAAYLDWIVDEIGRQSDRPAAAGFAASYRSEIWAEGWKNPTHGLIRRECDDKGEAYGRRKVCCLRYGLPGVGGCGISCPLPQGRA